MDSNAVEACLLLLDDLPEIHWRYDPATETFTWLNRHAERTLGFSLERMRQPKFWQEHLHPDDRAAALAVCDRACASGEDQTIEYRMLTSDGRTIWLRDRIRVSRASGTTVLFGVMFDVTVEKQATEELKFRKALLEAQTEASLDGILVVDRDRRVLSYNRRFAELWGIPDTVLQLRSDEALVQSVLDQLPDPAAFVAVVNELSASPDARSFDEVILKDGRAFDRYSAPIRYEGSWYGRVWFFRDATERRQMQAKLLMSSRMASLGTLAAGVAHEINNPMAYVTANLEFLSEGLPCALKPDADEEFTTALREAREGASRVVQIVRDLKTFSRSDENEQVTAVDLARAVDNALAMARTQIRPRATVRTRYGNVPLARGMASRLEQVFLNLLINAAQAIPEGAPESNFITVDLSARGDKVIADVTDTGPGIPASVLPRIFDPFFTTKPVGVGTGLGLSVCHGIITGLGGELLAFSEPGKGATFRVELPVAEEEPDATVSTPVAKAPLVRQRVLIIDDEVPLLGAMQRLLRDNFDVVTESRAAAALERLHRGERFDHILCDLQMPEMSGMDVFESLSRKGHPAAAQIVFLSGGAVSERARQFIAKMDRPVLAKPVSVATLRELLADKRGR